MSGAFRLNHAVLYVSDAQRSAEFYRDALGMETVSDLGPAVFLRLPEGDNHHDLGLFTVGASAGAPTTSPKPGLYHLAWEVDSFETLVALRAKLADMGSLAGESDHGVTLSLYCKDPDGIEFEVCWTLPRDAWGESETEAVTRRLDWNAAASRWG